MKRRQVRLTHEHIDRLTDAIGRGLSRKAACLYAGIGYSSFHKYLQESKTENARPIVITLAKRLAVATAVAKGQPQPNASAPAAPKPESRPEPKPESKPEQMIMFANAPTSAPRLDMISSRRRTPEEIDRIQGVLRLLDDIVREVIGDHWTIQKHAALKSAIVDTIHRPAGTTQATFYSLESRLSPLGDSDA